MEILYIMHISSKALDISVNGHNVVHLALIEIRTHNHVLPFTDMSNAFDDICII
jgi:hypothetical protein